jgi:organic radical activating enzyme
VKEFTDEILKRKKEKDIYIYGAGLYAQRVYQVLLKDNVDIAGFVVTNDDSCNRSMFQLPIYKAKEVDFRNILLIIGANRHNSIEIKKYLETRTDCNLEDVIVACEYLDRRQINENYYEIPTIEFTTVIGCKVNCKYCPQNLLISKYFENNLNRDKIMSMDIFRKCLNHLPHECNIQFCGMAEPFLNKNCSDMIIEASEAGKHIELYTTLVGATEEDIKKIWDLPLDYVNIHIPDSEGNAKIPITNEYLQMLSEVVKHKKKDDTFFVNLCNSQGMPSEEVLSICQDKFDIATVLHDRAGNLDAPMLIHKENKCGKLSCTLCGQELNHNVLLADGTVLLCCMDYGMKHVIGNLAEQTYEEIIHGREIERIRQGMYGDEEIDILCRKCSNASKIG